MVKIQELNGRKMSNESNGKYKTSTFSKVEINRHLCIVLIYAYRAVKDGHIQLEDILWVALLFKKYPPQKRIHFSFYRLLS